MRRVNALNVNFRACGSVGLSVVVGSVSCGKFEVRILVLTRDFFALIFCLLVFHTGHWLMETSEIRKASNIRNK